MPFRDASAETIPRADELRGHAQHRLPGSHFFREYAEAGLLLAYGPRATAQFRRAATYIDGILKGISLTIPPSVLQRADQVIE